MGPPQIWYKTCPGFTGGTSQHSGGPELTTVLSSVVSRRYSILCELRWYAACLAPCGTGKREASQTPLDVKPLV